VKSAAIATLGVDHVKMSEQCSAAIANELEKQVDPRCPTIPCSIGSFKFENALCNLGASVSVMPRNVFKKLCLPELEPTAMCLELGDNSISYPFSITVDVPVKVRHHFIHVGFMVLEMGEREKPPLILGMPFLKTWELRSTLARRRSSSISTAREVPSSFDHTSRYAI
jgi:hypothetical protein